MKLTRRNIELAYQHLSIFRNQLASMAEDYPIPSGGRQAKAIVGNLVATEELIDMALDNFEVIMGLL